MLYGSQDIVPFLFRRITDLNMRDVRNAVVIALVCWLFIGRFRWSVSHDTEKLLVVPAPEPIRFFPRGSPVKDFYLGNTSGLSLATATNDLTFAFLYAPWCLFSRHARSEFEAVARLFRNQAGFIAVNCAWHVGSCANHKRPPHFPLIGAYIGRNQRFFVPFGGIPAASHLEIFARRIIKPYSLITRREEFDQFVHMNDIAVVGAFSGLAAEGQGLHVFWNVSLMVARHDPRGSVGFAVVNGLALARKLGLFHTDAVYVYRLSKEVQVMPHISRLSDSLIEGAILRVMKSMPLKWIFPTFQKSFALNDVLRNATVIFFTPYHSNPRYSSELLNMLHRLVAAYGECDRSTDYPRLLSADRHARLTLEKIENSIRDRCRLLEIQYGQLVDVRRRFSNSPQYRCLCLPEETSTAFIHDICWTKSPFHSTTDPVTQVLPPFNCPTNRCSNILSGNRIFSACCYLKSLDQLNDQRVTLAQLDSCRKQLRRLTRDFETRQHSNMTDISQNRINALHGLKCTTNRTLEFAAIDPTIYPYFLNIVDTLDYRSSHVVIVDKKASEKYVYSGEITMETITDFILNYTNSQLVAYRKSAVPKKIPGHASRNLPVSPPGDRIFVTIEELSSNSFLRMLDSEQDDVVVLYYTQWCTFCKSAHSVLYNLASACRNISGISFKRINIDENDLPWENKIINVPIVQIFPTRRKRDNVATFPFSSPLNLLNLLKFTLLHVRPSVWHDLVSSRCTQECWHWNRVKSRRLLRVLQKELKLIRNVLSLTGHCDIDTNNKVVTLKWRLKERRLKIKILRALLLATSGRVFIDHVLNVMTSNGDTFDDRNFMRSFFYAVYDNEVK